MTHKVVTLSLFPPPSPPANFWQVPKYEEEKRLADYESRCLRKQYEIRSVAAVAEIVKLKGTLKKKNLNTVYRKINYSGTTVTGAT